MKKKLKKKYVILGCIMFLFVISLMLYMSFYNKSRLQENLYSLEVSDDNELKNETTNTTEIIATNNDTLANEVSDTETKETEEIVGEKVTQKVTQQTTTTTNKSIEEKVKEVPKSQYNSNQEQTKTESSTNNSGTTIYTPPTIPTKPEDTIKRISQKELEAEKSKYLSDIKNIKPNLKYEYRKRGQVFWPYRTNEINIAIGGINFGTIYYYVDIFVEGNQENFRYYIDWAG